MTPAELDTARRIVRDGDPLPAWLARKLLAHIDVQRAVIARVGGDLAALQDEVAARRQAAAQWPHRMISEN